MRSILALAILRACSCVSYSSLSLASLYVCHSPQ